MKSTTRSGTSALAALAGLALVGTGAQAVPPPAPVELAPLAVAAGPAEVVPGSYVVVMQDGASSAPARVSAAAAAEAEALGADVEHVFGAIGGYAAELSPAELAAVRADPDVAFVEPVTVMTTTTTQQGATWGLDRVDQRDLPLSGTYTSAPTGAGVDVYVVDTGVQPHAELGDRLVAGFDAFGVGTDDCQGHGTHVAGTVAGTTYGVAKQATVVPVRVLGCDGQGTSASVIAGVDWVAGTASGPSVANLSLGGGVSTALDQAVRAAVDAGVTVVVAAGNENQDACAVSPAREGSAITVGASTRNDSRDTGYSNFGSCLDVFAPGTGITSAWIGSATATRTISGTSMAAPHVAGVAALYLQGAPAAPPSEVTRAIVSTATTDVLSNVGPGSPNRLVFSPLTGGGSRPPSTTGPCANPRSGSFTGPNQSAATAPAPAPAGVHRGCLTGPADADLDLYLQQQLPDGTWRTVASAVTDSSTENITFSAPAGTYRWLVRSFRGGGAFTLTTAAPL